MWIWKSELIRIRNVTIDVGVNIECSMSMSISICILTLRGGLKKFFQLLVGHAHVCVFGITGANARGAWLRCESTNFQCGLEKFDVERCVRRYVEGRD